MALVVIGALLIPPVLAYVGAISLFVCSSPKIGLLFVAAGASTAIEPSARGSPSSTLTDLTSHSLTNKDPAAPGGGHRAAGGPTRAARCLRARSRSVSARVAASLSGRRHGTCSVRHGRPAATWTMLGSERATVPRSPGGWPPRAPTCPPVAVSRRRAAAIQSQAACQYRPSFGSPRPVASRTHASAIGRPSGVMPDPMSRCRAPSRWAASMRPGSARRAIAKWIRRKW